MAGSVNMPDWIGKNDYCLPDDPPREPVLRISEAAASAFLADIEAVFERHGLALVTQSGGFDVTHDSPEARAEVRAAFNQYPEMGE